MSRWRRGRDSNPRDDSSPSTHFPGVRLQPLGHPSVPRLLFLVLVSETSDAVTSTQQPGRIRACPESSCPLAAGRRGRVPPSHLPSARRREPRGSRAHAQRAMLSGSRLSPPGARAWRARSALVFYPGAGRSRRAPGSRACCPDRAAYKPSLRRHARGTRVRGPIQGHGG